MTELELMRKVDADLKYLIDSFSKIFKTGEVTVDVHIFNDEEGVSLISNANFKFHKTEGIYRKKIYQASVEAHIINKGKEPNKELRVRYMLLVGLTRIYFEDIHELEKAILEEVYKIYNKEN